LLNTAVGLCIFDRPDTTELVFQAIARAKPKKLFVFADGPRSPAEAEVCESARAVTRKVSWDCDVKYDYSEENLGCALRTASGIDWVFSEVDEAIILDDDCIPDPTFFPFCEAMLERYRDDPRVMMVTGSNYLQHWKDDRQSYHFSHFGSVWGWASWKRSWEYYDLTMAAWSDEDVKARIRDLLSDDEVFTYQARRFDWRNSDPAARRHSWDLPWVFARLAQGGLSVVPSVNLITNVGNTEGRGIAPDHPIAHLRSASMSSPLRFQPEVEVDRDYDKLHVQRMKGPRPQSAPEPRRRSRARRRLVRAPRRFLGRALQAFPRQGRRG
jgi:hypothetical protein